MGILSLLEVEHPQLNELEIVDSDFERVDLNWLPKLSLLNFSGWISQHDPLSFGYVPLLQSVSITNIALSSHKMLNLSEFLGKTTISDLCLNFRMQVWDDLCDMVTDEGRRKVHGFSEYKKDKEVEMEASAFDFKHHNLAVLRIFGFQSEDKFVSYIRSVMEAAVVLEHIYLYNKPVCKICKHMVRKASRYPWKWKQRSSHRDRISNGMCSPVEIHFPNSTKF